MKTFMAKKETQKMNGVLVDAKDKVLGRLATQIAGILRGKDQPDFTHHVEGSTGVVVINADLIKVTGNKAKGKRYYWHTGHPGGVNYRTFEEFIDTNPELPISLAVKGMLPKNRTRKFLMKKLRVFKGAEHDLQAQNPKALDI